MYFFVIRVFIGVFFIISGLEKLLGPYQNFLYVVQNYELFDYTNISYSFKIEEIIARVIPWIELFFGVFLFLGLWIKWVLRGGTILIAGFMGVVGQALIRRLPITECGCLGQLISFPLHVVMIIDSIFLILIFCLLRKINFTSRYSLDNYFLTSDK